MKPTKQKIKKSVSINPDVFERLVVVCERLGVNVNAYLVNAVGQQLQRDEAPVVTQEKIINAMLLQMNEHMQTDEFNEQAEKVAKEFLVNKKP
jgi:hypothetical protein